MTENEAKKFLERFSLDRIMHATRKEVDVERFNYFTNVLETAIASLEEIQQYRSIGTVSECREAVEKQKAKKPIEEKGVYASGQSDYVCPSCGDSVMMLDPECQAYKLEYCASCGQHLNWGV